MRVIWKFELDVGVNRLKMPPISKLLYVAEQYGALCIWAECLENTAPGERCIEVVLTGSKVPRDAKYVGTVLLRDGSFVVHVYDHGEMLD